MSNFFRNIHPLLRRNKRPEKYDDTNFAVLNALNYELTQAEQETIASKIQSSLESATDTYLDTWGDWFGVYRKDGWDDEYYRARIIRELLLKRGTIPAIIDALVDFLNDNDAVVQIYEPWRNIFYTNKSKLNGDDHLMGYYYRFAIIDISIDRPFPPEIVEIIKAFKPAGVLFYLRLDTSLAKNKTTVESPYVYLDVTNKTELEFLNGLYYDLRGNINLSDQRTQVVGNNIFHTNNSKLNGEDVLAGAFNHGRGYVHLASTTLLDYTPKATDSMSNLKTTLGEAGSDMYNQTKEKDGRTASIQVPATKNVHTLYSNSLDFGDYDYSTSPNLLHTLDYSRLSRSTSVLEPPRPYIKDYGDYFVIEANDAARTCIVPFVTRLTKGKTYTLSVTMMVDDEFANNQGYYDSPLNYTISTNNPAKADILCSIYPNADMRNQWKRVSKVFTVPANQTDGDYIYLQLWQNANVKGKLYVRYDMMIQEGDQTSSQAPANQMPKITTDKWWLPTSMLNKVDEEGNITNFKYPATTGINKITYLQDDKNLIPVLSDKKQYTLSAEIWLEKEVNAPLAYRVTDINGKGKVIMDANTINVPAKQWTEVSVTKTLDLPSNPNIADSTKKFPIKTRAYSVYSGTNTEPYIAGQQYTITMKATKPATQVFNVFLNEGTIGFGTMTPVEGLTDVWQKKVTVSQALIDAGVKDRLTIYQVPNSSVGDVQIDWLKIEKGETYTPDYPDHWVQLNTPESYEGIIKIKNDSIKIQEGATTTKPAWKPNLLDAPYYLSKVPLGENIADPTVKFPINVNTYKVYEGDMEEDLVIGQTYTITLKGTKVASNLFAAHNNQIILGILKPVAGLTDVWSLTFTPTEIDSNEPKKISIFQYQSVVGAAVKIDWLKIEKGNTRTPNIDSYDYVGSLIEDTETPTLDPTKYTWTVNGDVTNKKAYMVFDIKTFIEENYATEFEKLVADLGEDQALNAVFENFNISTALKALVSPSSPINFSVELYDFSTSTWHKLNTDSLDLRMRTFNLVANRITDYLNDYKLLFVRYVFDNKTDKDVTVELDMLNVLFNYRLGDGYSLGLQSTVECLSEIPLKRLALSSESVEVAIGETAKVTATPVPANATNKSLEWEIADPKTATVDTSGNITGVALGETTSTVYGEDRTISSTCSVSVKARHTLYSNSTDFGDYDYSGNPNLMRVIQGSDFYKENDVSISDAGYNSIRLTSQGINRLGAFTSNNIPSLVSGRTYAISAKVKIEEGTTGDIEKIRVAYRKTNSGTILLSAITTGAEVGKEITIKGTGIVNYEITDLSRFFLTIDTEVGAKIKGSVIVSDIKIEEGSTATPYQPNLLDAPYYFSKVALGENIASKNIQFPITTTDYMVYGKANTENYTLGQEYTVSIKATKPATQQFYVYVDGGRNKKVTLLPVEGLTDVWEGTFTVDQTDMNNGATKYLNIFQYPTDTRGTVKIDWVKIEKGDTRTPNIDSYAYRGTVLTTSEESPKDPNAYTWSSI